MSKMLFIVSFLLKLRVYLWYVSFVQERVDQVRSEYDQILQQKLSEQVNLLYIKGNHEKSTGCVGPGRFFSEQCFG
jgi:hypothetical protein